MTKTFMFIGASVIATASLILVAAFFSYEAAPKVAYGASDIISSNEITTATSVWVGKDIDTLVIASSTGRIFLEIGNISGATTTAQALYCNTDDRAAVLYSGLVIQASSSRQFRADEFLYRGALHCRFPVASSTVTILQQ